MKYIPIPMPQINNFLEMEKNFPASNIFQQLSYSFSRISERDYEANMKEWDYKITEKLLGIRRLYEKNAQY